MGKAHGQNDPDGGYPLPARSGQVSLDNADAVVDALSPSLDVHSRLASNE